MIVEDVLASDIFVGHESQAVLTDAGVRAVVSTPLLSSSGGFLGIISTHYARPHRPEAREIYLIQLLARQTADYLERKRAEQIEKMMVQELNHRSNNLLAVVQAIAVGTITGQAKIAFEARLQALARANRALLKSNWGAVDLAQIVRTELQAFPYRVTVDGPNVVLGPEYAQKFGIALHELLTNAAKYGALSNESGAVAVVWKLEDSASGTVLTFKWQERGGPTVRSPVRQGFGTQTGLRCEFNARLSLSRNRQ